MQLILFFISQGIFYVSGMMGQNVRQAQEGEFPFVIAIKKKDPTNDKAEIDYICTGVMISAMKILTVSHNIKNYGMEIFEIVYGSVDLRGGHRAPIQWILTYQQWADFRNVNCSDDVDLAILKLYQAISVTPVVVSSVSRDKLYKLNVVTTGWGDNAERKTPRIMEKAGVKIIKPSDCKSRILGITGRSSTRIHRRLICTAADPVVFLRQGDSGGPLLYHNQLVAINKGSCPVPDEDLNPQKVNIHTAIDDYRNFLTDVLANY